MINFVYDENKGIIISHVNTISDIQKYKGILFLDRDGVIIEECHYIRDPRQVKLIRGSEEIIHDACAKNWAIVIVTNQSGIARGYFGIEEYKLVTERMLGLLGDKSEMIRMVIACPLHPDAERINLQKDHYGMRKPGIGMLHYAQRELQIEPDRCILVGDKVCDIRAGICGDIAKVIHVETGHGIAHKAEVQKLKDKHPERVVMLKSIGEIETWL